MIEIVENCQVEWDQERGVLYVHNKDTGATIVRISKLPCVLGAKLSNGQIDVTARLDYVSMPVPISYHHPYVASDNDAACASCGVSWTNPIHKGWKG